MNRAPWIFLALLLMTSLAIAQPPLRVACVGDSITYGDQLADRDAQSYPAVLQRLSQGRLVAGNFGVNGATALAIPLRAWTDTLACRDALAFQPDLVVAMLGINDLAYPDQLARYPDALREIVVRFQALPSSPRVFLCTLTPIAPAEQQADVNRVIQDTMIPAIRAVAAETGAVLVDIAAVYPNSLELLPDGLHPSPKGAELIARTVLATLDSASAPPPQIKPAPVAGPVDLSIRNEARAAQARAAPWLESHPLPADFQDPRQLLAALADRADPDWSGRLSLLDPDASPVPCLDVAVLALLLARNGQETVFLPNGSPVAWREALLHQLVQRQRIDTTGGGFWIDPETAESAADALRSTLCALHAIATALGE